MENPSAPHRPAPFLRRVWADSWAAITYVGSGLRTAVPALAGFVFVPLALVLSVLSPLLPGLIAPVRALADVERRRAARMLGHPIPSPYGPLTQDLYRRSRQLIRSRATWRDAAWMVVHGLCGLVIPFLILPLWLAIPFSLTVPFWWWTLPHGAISVIIPLRSWPEAIVMPLVYTIVGGALLVWLTPRLARFEGWYADRLLGPTRATELAERVEALVQTRAGALEAHGAELRRIERDLHDGTQAHLVAATLRLGLADRRFSTDPDGARTLMLEARAGMEQALTELRTVVRGIYPPILSDRGLAGAVRALAAGRPIPVAVDIPQPQRRCPAAVEAAAYFVVAEALTNVAKHSGAAHASVSLRHTGPYLEITVHDDGHGGADPSRGSGLAGIRRRVAALDGVTRIDSQDDGTGTTLDVQLPCGL